MNVTVFVDQLAQRIAHRVIGSPDRSRAKRQKLVFGTHRICGEGAQSGRNADGQCQTPDIHFPSLTAPALITSA